MPTKQQTGIGAAIITAIAAVIVGYWQFRTPSEPEKVSYSGRVVNEATGQIVPNIHLTVDTNPPQDCAVGSDGLFYVELPKALKAVNVRVEAPNYEVYNHTVSVMRTGIEQIALKPVSAPVSSGLTFVGNPSLEQVCSTVARAKHVSITFTDKKCEQAAKRAVVVMNGGQLDGPDAKDFLEDARARTNLKFFVNIRGAGASYEIVCQ